MERIGYTRLYATLTGVALVLLGLFGLLENAEFDLPELHSNLLGFYAVNGWANAFHIAIGLLALVLARSASRLYALVAAVVFTALAIWGITAPNAELLFGKLPAERWVNLINLALGLGALACLIASYWELIGKAITERRRKRATRTSRRERRQRLKRQKQKTKSQTGPKASKVSKPSKASKTGS